MARGSEKLKELFWHSKTFVFYSTNQEEPRECFSRGVLLQFNIKNDVSESVVETDFI